MSFIRSLEQAIKRTFWLLTILAVVILHAFGALRNFVMSHLFGLAYSCSRDFP